MSFLNVSDTQIRRIEADFAMVPGSGWRERLAPILEKAAPEEQLCLKFLYAYMPASDLASYPPELFYKAVQDSLRAIRTLPWGEALDAEMFFNYVLPLRLNNENLTDHRERFYEELFPRVKGLSMTQAALEVNYWCFENATYRSTDDRTCSPLGVLLNAAGRCGEESVLCVAALRSVGIPARQCYTPRWAHCDDNHAWVEFWGGDRWHWIGACEPEPVPDRGWFVETSRRGMLVHAKAFTQMISEPEVTNQSAITAQVNVLEHYAPVKRLAVSVTEGGNPVSGAEVRFHVANFAELYPIFIQHTDENGHASFLTGYGDLLVQAIAADGRFLFRKAAADCTELSFDLMHADFCESGISELDLVPPPMTPWHEPEIPESGAALHEERIAHANACRKARNDSFLDAERAAETAEEFPEEFRKEAAGYLEAANGNWAEILGFLREPSLPMDGKMALLSTLRKKDFSDSSAEMLASHLRAALPFRQDWDAELFVPYVLCPRVENEWLTSYRQPLSRFFPASVQAVFRREPLEIWRWVEGTVSDCGDRDYPTISAAPAGLIELQYGSALSRKIFFVCMCRTLGIPARLSPLDGCPEYWERDGWNRLGAPVEKKTAGCVLTLRAENPEETFGYRKNFTVARLCGGVYETLGLSDMEFSDGKASCTLEPGNYRVMTANRQPDGSILAELTHISFGECGSCAEVALRLRQPESGGREAAELPEFTVQNPDGTETAFHSLLPAGENCAAAFISTGGEPTEHLLNELLEQPEAFREFAGRLVLIASDKRDLSYPLFCAAQKAIGFRGVLADAAAIESVRAALPGATEKFPLITDLNREGHCVHFSCGYNVGTGDRLLTHFRQK